MLRLRTSLLAVIVAAVTLGGGSGAFAASFERVIDTVRLAERVMLTEHGPELVLNGAGVRRRLFSNVYVGALYLLRRQNAAPAVIADEGPKRVLVHILREEIAGDQLVAAIQDGLVANLSAQELSEVEPSLREFVRILNGLAVLRKGAVMLLDYLPGAGTKVTVSGESRGLVQGAAFHRALLRVWLGERPVDDRLKQALLGS